MSSIKPKRENYTLKEPSFRVTRVCWVCSGTGFLYKINHPKKYQKCWCCYGLRGRVINEQQRKNANELAS